MRLVYATAFAQTASRFAAEDLTQETFLRAWENLAMLCALPVPAQRGWLLRTVRNNAIDGFRQSVRRDAREQAEARGETNEADPAAASLLRVDVARALAQLREQDREIVLLRYFGEMNSREIGEGLGLPEGTVRQRLGHCRRVLSQHLAAWGRPDDEGETT